MSNVSETYPLELLFPAESLALYFSLTKEVGVKDLVAAISCFDAEGTIISELKPLSFSPRLARHYVYLRSTGDAGQNWQVTTLSAEQPIKRVEVEIIRWEKGFDLEIKHVVKGVWAGEVATRGANGHPLNFVSIRGTK